MTEKQASSEIAQSRERFEKWAGPYRKETADPWAVWQAAEWDTRERCAQMVERAEKSRSMTTGMSYFMKELAGRIREHDRPETSHKCAEHIDEGPLESCNKCRCANVLNVEDRLPIWRGKE